MKIYSHLVAAAAQAFGNELERLAEIQNLNVGELAGATRNSVENARRAGKRAAELLIQEADTRRWGT